MPNDDTEEEEEHREAERLKKQGRQFLCAQNDEGPVQ
jgi:hypothetical protein